MFQVLKKKRFGMFEMDKIKNFLQRQEAVLGKVSNEQDDPNMIYYQKGIVEIKQVGCMMEYCSLFYVESDNQISNSIN